MMAVVIDHPLLAPRAAPPSELDRGTFDRCRSGDAMAFRAFVVRYEWSVFALISRICGRGPHVEDLAQETFLRAFRAMPDLDLDHGARVSTWLLTIATRLALDAKKRKVIAEDDLPPFPAPPSPDAETDRARLGRAIAAAAAALPDDQRAVFVLSEIHGLSGAEIATAVDVPEATVKTRLFRAREKLREALSAFREEAP